MANESERPDLRVAPAEKGQAMVQADIDQLQTEVDELAAESKIKLDKAESTRDGVYRRADGGRPSASDVMAMSEAEDRLNAAREKLAGMSDDDRKIA